MDVATEIVRPVIQLLMVPVKTCMGFVVLSSNYVEKMRTKMGQLDTRKTAVEVHVKRNEEHNLEIPPGVSTWLAKVEEIKTEVEKIPTGGNGCFNVKMKYRAGKESSRILERIEILKDEESKIEWTDRPKPLGKIDSKKASTSTQFQDGAETKYFESRDSIFKNALKSLQSDDNIQVIALCGMGGVGKTTMMDQMKKVVEASKTFNWIVKVVIGQSPNVNDLQQAISEQLDRPLSEQDKGNRAQRLQYRFMAISEGGKKKILVILDDLWKKVDLEDIGITSPLPSGFKLLITSRERQVCTLQGAERNSIFRIPVLEYPEAKRLFWEVAGLSNDAQPELHTIGEDIINRCGGLPIAIKTIASTLRDIYEKNAWEDARTRLQQNDSSVLDEVVHQVFKLSFENLKKDDGEIFILSGLFPDDFNIPREELTRYGWGLKLFKKLDTLHKARIRVNNCVDNLIRSNLLIESDNVGCVKMHDLVRDFVLSNFTEVKQASIVDHGDKSQWPKEGTSESCARILLKCTGMSEFPEDFNYPNLKLLKLMDGGKHLKFPEDFYQRMKYLEVVAYERIHAPFVLVTPQYSITLRTLCLDSCKLIGDFSVGELTNLEILNFAHCGIQKLPYTIGKLRKLKLLDLSGCDALRVDDGVFGNLVNLEELYMRVSEGKPVRFTEANCKEMEKLRKELLALEFEFYKNEVQPKNVSFKKLERFKISLGCLFHEYSDDVYSFNNMLKLVTNYNEVLDCGIHELFEKTEKLHLEVKDMICLGGASSPYSFCNLRVLKVSNCTHLKYLFTIHVANGLMKLEHLIVKSCPVLEALVCGDQHSGAGTGGVIKFKELKSVFLYNMPYLASLWGNENVVVELPQLVKLRLEGLPNFSSIYGENKIGGAMQPLLKKEDEIPKLEKLKIHNMENLKEIWPCEISSSEKVKVSMLRSIYVHGCNSLVNMFPSNPLPLLSHLEELEVKSCDSVEVLFNIDLGCYGEIEEEVRSSSLRSIKVDGLRKLREVWRIKDGNTTIITDFQAVESIEINKCKRFSNLFAPTATNFDLGTLTQLEISGSIDTDDVIPEKETLNVAFPSNCIHTFKNLRELTLEDYKGVEVVFEVESQSGRQPATTQQPLLLPYLEKLKLEGMERMSHVWKCNWNQFLILQKQPQESSFQNLTSIYMYRCKSIKYLFSPLMAKLLSNLKEVIIRNCDGIEEVVSNREEEDEEMTTSTSTNTTTSLFPHLHLIKLHDLQNLKRIGGCNELSFKFSQMGVISLSLCQYSREINIERCDTLSSVFDDNTSGSCTNVDEESFGKDTTTPEIPRIKNVTMLKLAHLKILKIEGCDLLEHIFTFSTLESLKQLEELTIKSCKAMKVIVKEEDGDQQAMSSHDVVFPRLKSITLVNLPNLVGFFLGKIDFQWPILDKVTIDDCPQMTVFTFGQSTTPVLEYIHTSLGKHNLECRLNFHVTTSLNRALQSPFLCSDNTSSCVDGLPWSFHNLIEVDVVFNGDLKKIIPSNELLQVVKKLEMISVRNCDRLEEVFEELEGTSSCLSESQTVVKLPNLRQVKLQWLPGLKYIWKINPWMVLEFPNLTRVYIIECEKLEHVFSCSMVGSLLQLQELHISWCKSIKVIVKEEEEEECDGKVNEIMLPSLKSLKLGYLKSLKGFFLGKEAFSFPSLDTLAIYECPDIKVFTQGCSAIPEETIVETTFGSFYAGEDINSFINTKQQEGFKF